MELKEVSNFIDSYKHFNSMLESDKVNHFVNMFDSCIQGYNVLKNVLEHHESHFANEFNLFSILNIERRETKTHTPFLTSLLDANGSHAQKDVFYKNFIKQILLDEKKKNKFLNISMNYLEIKEELTTSFGRIDIFIRHYDDKNPFCICIENKIFAVDQSEQLKRYYEYMRGLLGLGEDEILLVYLSPYGRMPSNKSIEEKERIRLIDNECLKVISYQKDIKNWLITSMKEVNSNSMNWMLNQYIKTIDEL